jgi:hypothetical protein
MALVVVVGALLALHESDRSQTIAAFVLGAVSVAAPGGAWLLVVAHDGQQFRRLGARAEVDTSGDLHDLERAGWSLFDDVELDGFNVDHVLVGPGGVFAVETKWTSVRWTIDRGTLDAGRSARPDHQARAGARRIRLLLKHHARVDCHVVPVVVVWGPGRPHLEDGVVTLRNETLIAQGGALARHIRTLPTDVLDDDSTRACEAALRAYVEDHDRYLLR